MTDFKAARKNMIDCQIRPNGVIAQGVIDAFESVQRELFVPENVRAVAYCDEDVVLGGGRFLMESVTHARLLETLDVQASDAVLDVGCATGYSTAVLSPLAGKITALESAKALLDQATKNWERLGIRNVTGVVGDLAQGAASYAPFDKIFINGAVADIPLSLVAQLRPGGRMALVLRKQGAAIGQAVLVENTGKGASPRVLFDATCPYLCGFEPKQAFSFQAL